MTPSNSQSDRKQDMQRLTRHGGFVRLSDFVKLQLVGKDAKSWLHNFCTADIKSLKPGQGSEAFVLDVKGKTIAHTYVLVSDFDITVVGLGQPVISLKEHFDRYIIREDVSVLDQTGSALAWIMVGQSAGALIDRSWPESQLQGYLSHRLLLDNTVAVKTAITCEQDWLLVGDNQQGLNVEQWLADHSIESHSSEAFELARIRQCTPLNGADITTDHLPQEMCRDKQAISFTKGCYLGQETVARIDALGHVNQFFVKLKFDDSDQAVAGTKLEADEKQVGAVTSVASLEGNCQSIAVGFVRRNHADVGTLLESEFGNATIIE